MGNDLEDKARLEQERRQLIAQRNEREWRERREQERQERYEQERLDQERDRQAAQSPKRRFPPVPAHTQVGLATRAGAQALSHAPNLPAAAAAKSAGVDIAEDARVGEAVNQGFGSGFADGLSAASPLGAMARLAEEVEAAELSETAARSGVEARMERFPELRNVEVPTGNAARFPELAQEDSQRVVQQPVQDDGFER